VCVARYDVFAVYYMVCVVIGSLYYMCVVLYCLCVVRCVGSMACRVLYAVCIIVYGVRVYAVYRVILRVLSDAFIYMVDVCCVLFNVWYVMFIV